jgi:hypothetical protein
MLVDNSHAMVCHYPHLQPNGKEKKEAHENKLSAGHT